MNQILYGIALHYCRMSCCHQEFIRFNSTGNFLGIYGRSLFPGLSVTMAVSQYWVSSYFFNGM